MCSIDTNSIICNCPTCSYLLRKIPTEKVEIWWGSGCNGKTSLFNQLKESFQSSELSCHVDVQENQLLPLINILSLSLKKKEKKINARYIIHLNYYPTILGQVSNLIEVYHFTHTFCDI